MISACYSAGQKNPTPPHPPVYSLLYKTEWTLAVPSLFLKDRYIILKSVTDLSFAIEVTVCL